MNITLTAGEAVAFSSLAVVLFALVLVLSARIVVLKDELAAEREHVDRLLNSIHSFREDLEA